MPDNQFYIELTKAQSKFDYFFLAVIIGLLSLSIQSYDISEDYHSNYLVIGTWILLLISFFSGFLKEISMIKFRQVDLQRSANEDLASKYLNTYNKVINKSFKIQITSFYFAIIFYGLFKISNIYKLSFDIEILILISAAVIGFVGKFAHGKMISNVTSTD